MRRITAVGITIVVSMGFLLSLATSEESKQRPRRQHGSQVVDADGKLVGDVIGIHFPHVQELPGAIVAFNADGFSVPLLVLRNRFSGGQSFGDTIFFESNDCSGPPFMQSFVPGLPLPFLSELSLLKTVRGVVVNEPGNTVYRPGDTSQSVDVESSRSQSGSACSMSAFTTNLLPAFQLLNLDMFTPPFSLR